MDVFLVMGLALLVAFAAVLLKQYQPTYVLPLLLLGGLSLLWMLWQEMTPILETIQRFTDQWQGGGQYGVMLVKALGLCYVVQLGADVCRDNGQTAMAGKVELAGKCAVVLLALPLFEDLMGIILQLLQ